ncbi:MAG TPA: hypothetical protein VKM56_05700 [Verrucomicrobiae bacterium]|nr:hypothetical protein [Verrucomicrobiae bacterium]
MFTFRVQNSKDNRLVCDYPVKDRMRKAPEIRPSPLSEPNAVARWVLGD